MPGKPLQHDICLLKPKACFAGLQGKNNTPVCNIMKFYKRTITKLIMNKQYIYCLSFCKKKVKNANGNKNCLGFPPSLALKRF